jgi:transposase-like protein
VKYTPDQRIQAVALADEVGPAEASRRLNIPKRTISSWRKPAHANQKTLAARQALADKRTHLSNILLDKAVIFAEALEPGKDPRTNATALGIIIDKYRLEQGEVTDRTESVTQTEVDREIEVAVNEWRRQFDGQ